MARTVAVVEDDASGRRALGRLLRAAGYDVETYASAEEFLATPAGRRAGCLVLDVHLPGLSGLDLQCQLEGEGKAPPIVFITAHENPEYAERARRLGCVAFLAKPVPGAALLAAVGQAVSARGSVGE